MKVHCDRINLAESLNSIIGIIPPNSPKPILSNFYLSTESGSLVAEATDLEISGKALIHKVEVLEEGQVVLPSNKILSIIREIPDEFVNIYCEAGDHRAVIESNGFEFKILGQDPEEFPKNVAPETIHTITLPRERFHDSLKRVSVATSRDPTRYQLNGVFLEIEKKGRLTMTATDGKRLTHDHFRIDVALSDDSISEGEPADTKAEDIKNVEISAILPNQAIDVFLKVLSVQGLDNNVALSLSETHVTLKTRDHQISSNLVDGMFPNYKSVFPPEAKVRLKSKRASLLSAARSSSLTTDKQTSTVIFKISSESLILESNAQDIGESRIEIPVEVTGEPLEIRFNPVYFIDALRTFDEDEVTMELTDATKPAILKSSKNYRHLVMPLVNK